VTTAVVDDHLLRDILTGERPTDLDGFASSLATTGLWLFRLSSAWPMARLQHRHRVEGQQLSAAMVEALAAAQALGAAICVSRHDVGPNLKAAAEHDGIAFHVL